MSDIKPKQVQANVFSSRTLSLNSNGIESIQDFERLDLNDLDNMVKEQKLRDANQTGLNANSELLTSRNRRSYIQQSVMNNKAHKPHRYETLLIKELLGLGIKKDKLEKALAGTGYQTSLDAINWLMKHSKDPILNTEQITSTRDFILVLCPINRLEQQISNYLNQVKLKLGTNEAHFTNQLPYMKLTSFFKIPDNQISNLHKSFDKLFKTNEYLNLLNKSLSSINIDLHASPQMILLYPDIESEGLIKEIVANFSKIVNKYTNHEINPYSKQLHLTLGYNYEPEQKKVLEDLAIQCINYQVNGDWEIRLYSRDARAESKHTYKVINSYKPKSENELYLKQNDYVFAISSSKDNLMKGISFSTGESGYFPIKNVERSAESDTWKIHKAHLLIGNPKQAQNVQASQQNPLTQSSAQLVQPVVNNNANNRSSFIATDSKTNLFSTAYYYSENPQMIKKFQANPHRSMQTSGTIRFFFARHGERVDLVFGPQWIEQSFDRAGKYKRINLNMPLDLPFRANKRDFLGDSPLTEIGQFQARLTGEALGNEGFKIHYCYSSPALRCIQTATQILTAQGLEKIVKIRIEPSIFEFLGWYDKGLPSFVSQESLVQFGFNIDVNYRPLLPLERLQPDENYTDYYQRSFNLSKYLNNLHQGEGANILVIGHAGTLEVCSRQICGSPVRPYPEFNATIRKVPYLGLAMVEKEGINASFEIQQAIIPPLGHTANFNFDPFSLKL